MIAMGSGPAACGTPRKVRVIQEEAQAREAMYRMYSTVLCTREGGWGGMRGGERERGCCLLLGGTRGAEISLSEAGIDAMSLSTVFSASQSLCQPGEMRNRKAKSRVDLGKEGQVRHCVI
jgi:hypothetical protein